MADNTSITVSYCYTRPLSRRHVGLNIKFNFVIPIKRNFFLQLIINYRYGNAYKEVINTNRIDLCALMGAAGDNLLYKIILPRLGDALSTLVHKCPYTGSIELKDL
jgi:hypothetical protein